MCRPNFDLTGKVAIVTGGSRGIGFAIASCYTGAGAKVVIANRRAPDGEAAAQKIRDAGGEAIAISVDVQNPDSVREMVEKTVARYGRIDIMVNNAGRAVVKSVLEHRLEDWEKVMNTNLRGAFLCSQAVAPYMIKQGKGKIISTASTASVCGFPNRVSYVVSKAGVLALTKALATEWAPYKINVNAIAPSFTETEFTRAYFEDENNLREALSKTPLGRLAQPSDMTGLALFLASDASDYITGQTIFVDGGWTAG